jgi:C4-dicarboxylate-binding protein DctP
MMKNKKYRVLFIFILIVVISLVYYFFINKQESFDYKYRLRFSCITEDKSKIKAMEYFKQRLESLSKNKIYVDLYTKKQSFDSNYSIDDIKLDTVQLSCISFDKFVDISPKLSLFDLPFLFEDLNQVHYMQDGLVGYEIKQDIRKQDVIALTFWDGSFRQFTSNTLLRNPRDLKNKVIGSYNSLVSKEQYKMLNAKYKNIHISNMYKALDSKDIDSQESTLKDIYKKDIYKKQKNLLLSNHSYNGYVILLSPRFYSLLSPNLENALVIAMEESTLRERQANSKENADILKSLQKYALDTNKIKINGLLYKETKKWKKVFIKVYEKFYDKNKIGKDLINYVRFK